MNRTTSCGWF